jgi:hypothetical protein
MSEQAQWENGQTKLLLSEELEQLRKLSEANFGQAGASIRPQNTQGFALRETQNAQQTVLGQLVFFT